VVQPQADLVLRRLGLVLRGPLHETICGPAWNQISLLDGRGALAVMLRVYRYLRLERPLKFVLLGFSHKTAPVEIREKLDFSKKEPKQYLDMLRKIDEVSSAIVLSTCNRVEIYATSSGDKPIEKKLEKYLEEFHGDIGQEAKAFLYKKKDREAVRHLFSVAASLDSLIVGEPQILGQVKGAYFDSMKEKFCDTYLDRIFQKTFSVAKKVRTETKIAEQAVSISFMAVELAKKIFGKLSEKTVMIVGAGEMAELCAKHLSSMNPKAIYFTNRTYEHSLRLSQEFKGIPMEWDQYKTHLAEADIVITSTGASDFLIDKEDMSDALAKRKKEPIFVIDISVPRNVDPAVNELENVYLYNIDDLQGMVDTNVNQRREEAVRAAGIVDIEVSKFFQNIEKLKASPVIQLIQEKYQGLMNAELAKLEKKLSHADEQDRKEIAKAFQSFLKKALNDPIVFASQKLPNKSLDVLEDFHAVFGLSTVEDDEDKDE